MSGLEEVNVHEVTPNKTLHGLANGLAYYNYEGTHFRVFGSFAHGLLWLEDRDDEKVIGDFDTSDELDEFLENFELRNK